jgi:hypothetical protein
MNEKKTHRKKTFFFYLLSCTSLVLFSSSLFSKTLRTRSSLIEIPPVKGWVEIKPGGDSICARGEPFSFFFYQGTSDKLAVDFVGGGACWNEETCSNDGIFYDSVDDIRDRVERGLEGLYDHSNAANPIKNWSHIVIPYCTGDIHWGDSVVTYGTGEKAFKIHHKGAANVKSVMEWIKTNLQKQPQDLLVTGCSAGSYGSVYWTPHLKEMFPKSSFFQLGDSGVGVVTDDFFRKHFSIWNPMKNVSDWIPGLDPRQVDWYRLKATDMYEAIGDYYPDVKLSQFTTAYDSTQIFFYELMGGGGEAEWSQKMFSFLNRIENRLPNFSYYVAGGQDHCVIPYNDIYKVKAQNVSFIDWFQNYLDKKPMRNVVCDKEECDPITD